MAKFCTNCGAEISEGYAFCEKCGTPVEGGTPQAQPIPQPQVVVNNVAPTTSQSNGMAIAGFVTSLVNAILCCGGISLISLILSIVGCVNAKKYNGNGKGLAIAGIIISAIFMVIGLIYWLFFGLAWFATIIEEGY